MIYKAYAILDRRQDNDPISDGEFKQSLIFVTRQGARDYMKKNKVDGEFINKVTITTNL